MAASSTACGFPFVDVRQASITHVKLRAGLPLACLVLPAPALPAAGFDITHGLDVGGLFLVFFAFFFCFCWHCFGLTRTRLLLVCFGENRPRHSHSYLDEFKSAGGWPGVATALPLTFSEFRSGGCGMCQAYSYERT